LDEVNFWQPGGGSVFNKLLPGELLLFRLKSPVNRIAGGGFFTAASIYPLNGAWDAFREKNGVATYTDFFNIIAAYRRKMGQPIAHDSAIGCIVLERPFFLPESDWIEVPRDYSLNLVQGKRFISKSTSAQALLEWATEVLRRGSISIGESTLLSTGIDGPVYGEAALQRRRLGQGGFRLIVSDAYNRRCAITGEKTLPVLEAAHIRPLSLGGEHRIDNGLLMRSDVHTLFDLGYLTVTPAGQVRVSSRLRENWLNGRIYYDLDGAELRQPQRDELRPSRLHLEWHNDEVFRR
jgi:putative restriction endonuclease